MSKDDRTGSPKDSHYARLRRVHRERTLAPGDKPHVRPRPRPGQPAAPPLPADGLVRLYGLHTVRAALDNPRRRKVRLLATRNALQRLDLGEDGPAGVPTELVEPRALDALLGADAVHQGVVLEAEPLKARPLSKLGEAAIVVVLDQVTDPHNVGAVIRSAVAFGAGALVTTHRHSPQESGVLAKAASGALEHIDHIEVRNLAEALSELSAAGYRTIGLDSEGEHSLEAAFEGSRVALVLGAEGRGLRQKTRHTVDVLARLDMPGVIKSLNVSNAAAVALYAARRHLDGSSTDSKREER